MVKFTTTILKFGEQGEKTGWTYIVIRANVANKIKAKTKVSFRVKGKLDDHPIRSVALLPFGEGDFIMPINSAMRKAIRKKHGDKLIVQLEEDKSAFVFNKDLILCLQDEPAALTHFKKLSPSHQRYFSKWIDEAKTDATITKRIAQAVNALARGMGLPEMLRELKANR